MQHLARQIAQLEKRLMTLGQGVLSLFQQATDVLTTHEPLDLEPMRQNCLSLYENAADLEEACLGTIALHVPVAVNLRQVITYLKTKEDLMRIADLSVALTSISSQLAKLPTVEPPCDIPLMAATTQDMLKIGLQALADRDAETAWVIREMDDVVDDSHQQMYQNVEKRLLADPKDIRQLLLYQDVSRHLERAADQTTRISKTVIYLAQGQIVRHNPRPQEQP